MDTNVLISAALSINSKPRQVLQYIRKEGVLFMSEETFLEFYEVLHRKKFDKYLSLESRNQIITDLLKIGFFLMVQEKINECRDPKDNKFLEIAVAAKADFLITGDKDLTALHPFRNIQILTPEGFLIHH